ncbi:MAG: type II toxin-antitoxin system VapC family toxin [Acidimicrobiales bacterium]|jgi:predicted nucleic acid-binding protein|nr:type II toxin-antitoxin system VapC family toxin [Acidimicrobiales bacterium]HMS89507.1 type II toxin-antitoxin system VapC family toxin [Acidimicrobiales bacterium]
MGLTVLDAGVLIGFLDRGDAHHHGAIAALRDAAGRNDRLFLPASAFAEILVGPSRQGAASVAVVPDVLGKLAVEIEPLDADVAVTAAALRARHRSLKLPDALVIATAIHLDADHLVTTDRRWPSRSRLGLRGRITEIRASS